MAFVPAGHRPGYGGAGPAKEVGAHLIPQPFAPRATFLPFTPGKEPCLKNRQSPLTPW